MSDQTSPPPSHRRQLGFWTGQYCGACAASALCGAQGTVDACGDVSEYPEDVVHGADFGRDTISELTFRSVRWPLVPRLEPAIPVLERMIPGAVVGIRWKTAVQPATWDNRPDRSDGYAVLIGRDQKLEILWEEQYEIARNLERWDVSLVIAPGFSTWWKHPPSESLLSMARSAEFARVLARHLPTVPCVVWRHADPDLERWARWLTSTECGTIAVDFQTHREEREWNWGVTGLSHLVGLLDEPLPRLVVNGPSALSRIRTVAGTWPGPVTILSQNPWQKAQQGWALDSSLDAHEVPELEKDELVAINVRAFRDAVASLLGPRDRIAQ